MAAVQKEKSAPVSIHIERGVTGRAVIIGLLMVVLLDIWVIYAEYIVRSSRLNVSHHFPVSVLALFVVLIVASRVWSCLGRGNRALSRGELLTVLAMSMAGIVIPSNGLTSYLIGSLSAPYYFATPENNWEVFHSYLQPWVAPDDVVAVRWFYEGLPQGVSIPWFAWAPALGWWAVLGAGFVWVSVCVASIFRRQWVEHERLVYPMLGPAMYLTEEREGGWIPHFAQSRLFWAGFGVSFAILGWNILSFFEPLIPRIPILGSWFSMARGFPYTFHTRINFLTVGFAYFANVSVLFSVWFFFALMNFEMLIMDRVGYTITLGGGASLPNESNPMITWQTQGAFIVFVGWSLWTARAHLKTVLWGAMGWVEVDDAREVMNSRFAVWGVLGGCIFILAWLHAAGMEIFVGVILLVALLVAYFGTAKMVAEIGLPYTPTTLQAEGFVVATMGTENMSPNSVTVLAFSQNMHAYGKGMVLPPLTNIIRIADFIRSNTRRLMIAVVGAFVVSYLVSTVYTLWLGYNGGAYNFSAYPFSYYSRKIFDRVVYRLGNPWQMDADRLGFLAIGAVGMGLLTFARYRIAWWRLNPIGFALPRLSWQVFSLFIAWACKAIILRLGGVQLYRQSQPFFVGLLVGYALGVGLSSVVDMIWFNGQGHGIHSW